ncbi:MAG: hypothetical protein JRI25_23075, partial [Deltaproteobacteria bacterium]|nr:hypothetical protein [Deltaproteobacteria bacterium]
GLTTSGWIFLLGILCFSLGEMLTGPKKNEYLGLIAPPGKKGLYLGYVNIPIGIGGYLGSKMAGYVYGNFGEKAVLAQKYLATEAPGSITVEWDGKLSTLETAVGVARPDAFARLMEVTNLDAVQALQSPVLGVDPLRGDRGAGDHRPGDLRTDGQALGRHGRLTGPLSSTVRSHVFTASLWYGKLM